VYVNLYHDLQIHDNSKSNLVRLIFRDALTCFVTQQVSATARVDGVQTLNSGHWSVFWLLDWRANSGRLNGVRLLKPAGLWDASEDGIEMRMNI